MPNPSDILTPPEVAEMFQVSVLTVTRWAREDKIAHFKTPSGRVRFRRGDVEKFTQPVEAQTA